MTALTLTLAQQEEIHRKATYSHQSTTRKSNRRASAQKVKTSRLRRIKEIFWDRDNLYDDHHRQGQGGGCGSDERHQGRSGRSVSIPVHEKKRMNHDADAAIPSDAHMETNNTEAVSNMPNIPIAERNDSSTPNINNTSESNEESRYQSNANDSSNCNSDPSSY